MSDVTTAKDDGEMWQAGRLAGVKRGPMDPQYRLGSVIFLIQRLPVPHEVNCHGFINVQ